MESLIREREEALEILEKRIYQLSNAFREGYLGKGRGAIVLYGFLLGMKDQFSTYDYSNKKDSLALYDDKKSREELKEMIENYDPKTEGILILITKPMGSFFITVKLKSRKKKVSDGK